MWWIEEFLKGILKVFFNPMFYWSFLLIFFVGYRRIKLERQQFNIKIYDLFSEWKRLVIPGIVIGLILSLILIGTGVVYSYGSLLVLSIMTIILSLGLRFTLLSASYTIGLSFIILFFLPTLLEYQDIVDKDLFTETNFTGLVLLLGLMLIVEAILIQRVRRDETFPRLVKSERGAWIGEHHLSKATMIPLFLLVPGGVIESFAPYWPLITLGEDTYGLVLFPFLLGFSHRVRARIAPIAASQLAKQISLLGLVVTLVAISAYFISGLSLVALLLAIIGRELITYRFRLKEKREVAFFKPQKEGLRVLGIIPDSPAARLDIQIGEQVLKVNNQRVSHPDEFYEALQGSGAYFKLDILDDFEEVRFVQSAFYETDHHRLGLLFIEEPHRFKVASKQPTEREEKEDSL